MTQLYYTNKFGNTVEIIDIERIFTGDDGKVYLKEVYWPYIYQQMSDTGLYAYHETFEAARDWLAGKMLEGIFKMEDELSYTKRLREELLTSVDYEQYRKSIQERENGKIDPTGN